MKTLVMDAVVALLAGCDLSAKENALLNREAYQAAVAPSVLDVARRYGTRWTPAAGASGTFVTCSPGSATRSPRASAPWR